MRLLRYARRALTSGSKVMNGDVSSKKCLYVIQVSVPLCQRKWVKKPSNYMYHIHIVVEGTYYRLVSSQYLSPHDKQGKLQLSL